MRRALVAAALLGALACAPPAWGQAGDGGQREAVVGGGSFLDAPLLEPGHYRDTILPGERLYYGIDLEAGQRLRIAARLEQGAADRLPLYAGFSAGVQTPLREVDVLDAVDEDIAGNSSVTVDGSERIEYVTAPVLAASQAIGDSGVYRGPGTWYVSLYMMIPDRRPPRIEFPVELELEVLGEPQPDPEPFRTPAPTPAPTEEASGSARDEGGTSLGTVLGLGAAGLAVGLVAGALAGARRRPR